MIDRLRTLLLSLMWTHSPKDLNIALIRTGDHTAFLGLEDAPHVVLDASTRAWDARRRGASSAAEQLARELSRRRFLLAHADLPDARAYQRAVREVAELPPMPTAVIAIHRFGDALGDEPALAEPLLAAMEEGERLGIHVLLQAHGLAGVRRPEFVQRCALRIVQWTVEAESSRLAMGTDEAARLPETVPGAGFLVADGAAEVRFTAWGPGKDDWQPLIEKMVEDAPVQTAQWVPPLSTPITLGDVLGELAASEERGLSATGFAGAAEVPIGLVDVPEEGRTKLLTVPVGGPKGNIVVSGNAGSGRAYAICSAMLAMALTRTPRELQFYGLSVAGGPSKVHFLRELPHLGCTATSGDLVLARAIVDDIEYLIRQRTGRRRSGADDPEDEFGVVYLIIEGWPGLAAITDLVPRIRVVAESGPACGVHLFISCEKHEELPDWLLAGATELELRSRDPGVGADGAHSYRVALPWLQGVEETHQPRLAKGADLARRIAAAWPWPPAPEPEVLPKEVPYRAGRGTSKNIALGPVRRQDEWAELDLARTRHVLCLGEPGSGKTALLRVVLEEIVRLHPSGDAVVVLVDPKRSMIGEAGAQNMRYLAMPHEFEAVAEEVVAELQRRTRRSAAEDEGGPFAGRRIFFLINDYEMAHGSRHLFDVLEPFVAEDIGFHLVVTRNSINSRNALEQGLLQRMLASGCASLVLSGEERDGELLPGVWSVPRPPGRAVLLRPGEDEVVVQIAWAS
ncbi:hypothetical protein HUO13_30980 [Saccharopolyspora erythraea]|uniref:FtsK/SpoIIIE domain-containing protein n=1 Tax=Saccharopolyspora erythraea TaxID=1836 RepID=UPI001BACCAAD|nr:FtsK/SpoIIIE domain-containing protein [Saccharopolyspora erythraea]QUH04610.1 hypothetical protein HUO13_30980 [Saccharopolyspora erythraea]